MRESNFAFPAQNRACVCISSQLYDRRALDTTSPLPLLNSLTHLTYLTSTSPRIREILTCDGGLERLVRLLRDFCLSPPPPENPSAIYGLSPPSLPRPAPAPTLNPKSFDRHAAYRFSLAFQCLVNIGVRGTEPIRSRVVQAGTLDVVGCVLEAWLASMGFAVGPSASASGLPRETREQRAIRRQQQVELRQREQAQELARLLALERQFTNLAEAYGEDEEMVDGSSIGASDAETSTSTDNSANTTPLGSGTPTGHVVVPGRDRSGTVVARPIWDSRPPQVDHNHRNFSTLSRNRTLRGRQAEPTPSTSTSRPDTETEDDGEQDVDGDVEMAHADENIPPRPHLHSRRAVGIVSDSPPPTGTTGGPSDSLEVDLDAHIIINTTAADEGMGGVEDGIVALDQNVNDDLALGAPPGAPGAIEGTPRMRANTLTMNMAREGRGGMGMGQGREELTPRAVLAALPLHTPMPVAMSMTAGAGAGQQVALPHALRNVHLNGAQPNGFGGHDPALHVHRTVAGGFLENRNANTANANFIAGAATARHHHHHHRHAHGYHGHALEETGPFREEDVVLALQLLAYLSKYPHVRQAFYKPRVSFHPATAQMNAPGSSAVSSLFRPTPPPAVVGDASKKDLGFFKSFAGRGKEKATSPSAAVSAFTPPVPSAATAPAPPQRMTNVFSLVERFTFRPSPTESTLPTPPPFLPDEIQYWAGVIMRNACRKDESRGGIRQCANMLCGKWESFPREFAKCRRCRKAKYCGKECQSRAWSEGHRFWCSAREGDDNADGATQGLQADGGEGPNSSGGDGGGTGDVSIHPGVAAIVAARAGRRMERERERQRLAAASTAANGNTTSPAVIANAVRAATAHAQRTAASGVAAGTTEQPSPSSATSARTATATVGRSPLGGAETVRGIRHRTNAIAGPSAASGAAAGTSAFAHASGRGLAIPPAPAPDLAGSGIPAISSRRRAGTIPVTQHSQDPFYTVDLTSTYVPYVHRDPSGGRSDLTGAFVADLEDGERQRGMSSSSIDVDVVTMRDREGEDMVIG